MTYSRLIRLVEYVRYDSALGDIHDMEKSVLIVIVSYMPCQSHRPVYGHCTSNIFTGSGYFR